MPHPDEALVRRLVGELTDPHTGQPMAAAIRAVGVDGDRVSVDLQLGYPAAGHIPVVEARVRDVLLADPSIAAASVSVTWRVHSHKVQGQLAPLPGVKNIIAVASGKGGVGKSTVSVNLALALAAEGASVAILDADIYGPSQPRMLGLSGKPGSPDGKSITPMRAHGLQAMSIGVLVEEDAPMIWRGPMVTQALMQLLTDTRWEAVDYLIIDLPPGTGDIQLTLSQKVPVSGAVIPTLGIVENMSTHICSNCGHEEHIFGAGGGARMAADYGVPLLGDVPLDIRIREQADGGTPTVAADPDGELAARYRAIARRVAGALSLTARNKAIAFPSIVIQNT